KDDLIPFATTNKNGNTMSIPFVQIKRDVLDELLKGATGKTLAETEKAIDADLKPHSAVLKDVQMTLNVKVKRQETMVKNVIGYLDGSGPLANETIVVGAHYDHLGYGGPRRPRGGAGQGQTPRPPPAPTTTAPPPRRSSSWPVVSGE